MFIQTRHSRNIYTLYCYAKPARLIESVRANLPDSWVVTGGTHATLCAEDLYKVADYTVLGEGVGPMSQIINYFKEGKKGYNMNGVVYNKDGKMQGLSELILKNILKMGSPDWSDLNLNFLDQYFWRAGKRFRIFTSKGCPFNCSYCSNQLL